jgi:hypothetical protein
MVLAFPLLAGVLVSLALGGSLRALAKLRLRSVWLFYAAFAVQVVAFPFSFLPWTTPDGFQKVLWLFSYGLLALAAARNLHLPGVRVIAAGMVLNLLAIVANGGRMPVLPEAMRGAGHDYGVRMNSVAAADPHLDWLVDRWAAPEWVPLANVFSVGDVVIALGAVVLGFAATGVTRSGVLLRLRFGTGAAPSAPGPTRGSA